jgi:hypothetical protein
MENGFLGRLALARAKREIDHLVSQVGTNPRVPLSSCSANGYDPHAPDVLMPIRLRDFTANQSALAGHVTLVGKVMHAVHGPAQDYVDLASLRQWSGADFWTNGHEAGLQEDGLGADATVLAPGYVIQPVAIYK